VAGEGGIKTLPAPTPEPIAVGDDFVLRVRTAGFGGGVPASFFLATATIGTI